MPEPTFYRPHPPILCLTGIDGCGKSTQLRRLAGRLASERQLKAVILSVWDISRNSRYQSHPFISDKAAIYTYLASLHGGARMTFIVHALLESMELLLEEKPDVILADGYWYKYLFSEHLHGLPIEWLMKTVTGFPPPKRVILLDLPPEKSWERKPLLTPYECGMKKPGKQTFLSFQTKLRDVLIAYFEQNKLPVIEAHHQEDEVTAGVWKIMKDEV